MHVRVDEAGHEDMVVGLDDLLAGPGLGPGLEHSGDEPVVDDDGGRTDPVGEDRAPGADDELVRDCGHDLSPHVLVM